MKSEQTARQEPVNVPQYEEYRSVSWFGTLSQWLGGIGLSITGGIWLLRPGISEEMGNSVRWAAALFLMLFVIPAIRSRKRSRENQEISSRNRKKYEKYRSSLLSEQRKKP